MANNKLHIEYSWLKKRPRTFHQILTWLSSKNDKRYPGCVLNNTWPRSSYTDITISCVVHGKSSFWEIRSSPSILYEGLKCSSEWSHLLLLRWSIFQAYVHVDLDLSVLGLKSRKNAPCLQQLIEAWNSSSGVKKRLCKAFPTTALSQKLSK